MRIPKNPSLELPLKGLEGFTADFLVCRLEELEEVKSSFSEKDFTSMTKMAHKWRGISAPYGFGELAVLANELEECIETYQTYQCEKIINEIETYLASKGAQGSAVGP